MSAVIAENIPAELRALRQFVCWNLEAVEGRPKPAKIPRTVTGGKADTTNPATWATFDECVAYSAQRGWSGVGFVFTKNDPYVGLDFDGMTWAQVEPLVRDVLPAYVEVSQSGHGIHVIFKGKMPPGNKRRGAIECYEDGRYFALTGNRPTGDMQPAPLEDRTKALAAFHAKHLGGFLEPSTRSTGEAEPLSPAEVAIVLKFEAAEPERWHKLMIAGANPRRDDDSKLDDELARHLVRFTRDPETIERIMRHSALGVENADKWRRKDYLARTIAHALRVTATHVGDAVATVARTLAELKCDPDAGKPPHPLIPRFAWRGRMTIYTAPDKGGKSTLLTAGVAALLAGASFLGEPCNPAPDPANGGRLIPQQGTVLWAMLEEHPNDLIIRTGEWGVSDERMLVLERPRDAVVTVRAEAERLKPDVLVVDTLIEYAKLAAPESGSATQWNQIMNGLLDIARDLNIAVVILHHGRKSDGKARDSGDITARCDVVIEQLAEHSNGVQKLKVRGRYSRLRSFRVRLVDGDPGKRYELVVGKEEGEQPARSDTSTLKGERRKVLLALTGDMSFSDWSKAYGGNLNTFKTEARALRKLGLVEQDADGGAWSPVQFTVEQELSG